jgi:hypothetical protein
MLCPPALLYLILCSIQIIIDFIQGLYNIALIKIGVTIIMTIVLNVLCEIDLGIISWIIVLIPFLFMTIIASIILVALGLNDTTGSTSTTTTTTTTTNKEPIFTSPPLPPWLLPSVETQEQVQQPTNTNTTFPASNGIYLIM